MGKIITYRCDAPSCSQIRKATNHWYIWKVADGWFHCGLLEGNESIYDDIKAKETHATFGVACSLGCAQRLFEMFLSGTTPTN